MATMQELRGLAYPRTYMPAVAGTAENRNVLLVETADGPEGVAVRPMLLCQDWDQRVVIHWEDDRGSYTFTVTDVLEDAADKFTFVRQDEPSGPVWLTPLTFERFEKILRTGDPDAGNVPRFLTDDQFRRWFLPG